MQFTDDEIETIKLLIDERGYDDPTSDFEKVWALGVKLGVREPVIPPTEEELKRREEFRNSPIGLKISELLSSSNQYLIDLDKQYSIDVLYGSVRLPSGFKFNF